MSFETSVHYAGKFVAAYISKAIWYTTERFDMKRLQSCNEMNLGLPWDFLRESTFFSYITDQSDKYSSFSKGKCL